ncbi:MAG: GlsB/YeaQ/YmgE family stress response membrane protein [Caulobacterales bacterium]|nr:GlsB/YeaQ/YmgE family stress response membrane protein [Caulobacterales bacterium]
MDGVGIFAAIIIGILAGWIAERVLNRRHGLFTNLIVGVVGSFIGAFLAHSIGLRWGGFVGSLVVSTVGAILLLSILSLLRRR